MAETFGGRLLGLRLAGGYSRRELAEGAGISESAVRDYEQGKRSPSLEAALRLSVALGKSLSVWDSCTEMTTGAYRLPEKKARARALAFGQYKGRLLREVPTDYLRWMCEVQPNQATPDQLETARRLLAERGRDQQTIDKEARTAREATAQSERMSRVIRREEREAKRLEAQAERAHAARLAEENKRAEIEEKRRQRQEEQLRAPLPSPPKPPRDTLDDSLPWEKPPPEPPEK